MGLTEDAVKAKSLGYKSYGEYMMAKERGGKEILSTENRTHCIRCGKVLVGTGYQFCTKQCARLWWSKT